MAFQAAVAAIALAAGATAAAVAVERGTEKVLDRLDPSDPDRNRRDAESVAAPIREWRSY